MDREKRILELEQTLYNIQQELKELKNPLGPQDFQDGDWIYLKAPVIGSSYHQYVFRLKKNGSTDSVGVYDSYCEYIEDGTVKEKTCLIDSDNFTNFTDDPSRVEPKDKKYFRPAYHDEIKHALREIAKHRGFIDGAAYYPLVERTSPAPGCETYLNANIRTVRYKANCISCRFSDGKYYLFSEADNYIYHNGKWAKFVEQKKEYQDGDWVIVKEGRNFIVKLKSIIGDEINFYLAASLNSSLYSEFGAFYHGSIERKATYKEVETALRFAMDCKFFEVGKLFEPILFENSPPLNQLCVPLKNVGFDPEEYNLYMTGIGFIYRNETNEWAKPIKTFEIVRGYPVEYIDNDICKINGMQYKKRDILNLINGLEGINAPHDSQMVIRSLNVGCTGQYTITPQDLRDLIANWKYKDSQEFLPKRNLLARYGLNKFNL